MRTWPCPKAESKLSGSAADVGFCLQSKQLRGRGKEGEGRGGLCNNKKEAAAAWTMVVWSRQLGSTRLPGTVECGHLSVLVPRSEFLLGQ